MSKAPGLVVPSSISWLLILLLHLGRGLIHNYLGRSLMSNLQCACSGPNVVRYTTKNLQSHCIQVSIFTILNQLAPDSIAPSGHAGASFITISGQEPHE